VQRTRRSVIVYPYTSLTSGSYICIVDVQLTGKYMAISQDGILTTWNSQLTSPVVQQITTPNSPVVTIFVTCSTFMPAANVLVIATSNCDLLFYTYSSDKFERASRIWQLPTSITCISYYCDSFVRVSQHIHASLSDSVSGIEL